MNAPYQIATEILIEKLNALLSGKEIEKECHKCKVEKLEKSCKDNYEFVYYLMMIDRVFKSWVKYNERRD